MRKDGVLEEGWRTTSTTPLVLEEGCRTTSTSLGGGFTTISLVLEEGCKVTSTTPLVLEEGSQTPSRTPPLESAGSGDSASWHGRFHFCRPLAEIGLETADSEWKGGEGDNGPPQSAYRIEELKSLPTGSRSVGVSYFESRLNPCPLAADPALRVPVQAAFVSQGRLRDFGGGLPLGSQALHNGCGSDTVVGVDFFVVTVTVGVLSRQFWSGCGWS